MIPTKFGWNLPTGSGEEDENVKSLRTTDDGRRTTHDGRRTTDDARRTTDDGRKAMAIAHRAFGSGELKMSAGKWTTV